MIKIRSEVENTGLCSEIAIGRVYLPNHQGSNTIRVVIPTSEVPE